MEIVSPTDLEQMRAKDNKNESYSSVLAWFRGANTQTEQRTFSGLGIHGKS